MHCFLRGYSLLYLYTAVYLMGTPNWARAVPAVSLEKASVVVDVEEASYVHYTISELRQQVKSVTGEAPVLHYDLKDAIREAGPLVVVGRVMVGRLGKENSNVPGISDEEPGTQGFLLKSLQSSSRKEVILAAGSDSSGTNYAVMQLRQLLTESTSGLSVSAGLDLKEKPRSQTRGIYLHQHWRYNHPYATWSWSVEDWKRALDIAAYLRINLVMLWPHMDMIAPPLSIPEQDYLTDIRAVVDYAHRKRGIKVWIVEPANYMLNVEEAKRLPLEGRDYYAFHMEGKALKNPGDSKDFAALMANREAFYRLVPNADGYGFIDGDSGGYTGSPSSEFVDIMVGNRKLLDQFHERPQAKLIYWVWVSWGNGTIEENWRQAITDFSRRVSDPKGFLLGWAQHLKIGKELGILEQSIFFPYGVIEGEPTFPLTNINFEVIGRAFDYATHYAGVKGVMANAQTLLVQLPNIFYFIETAWSGRIDNRENTATLRALGRLLFPQQADVLAQGWSGLKAPGSVAAMGLSRRLEQLLSSGQTGRLGTVGHFVFPEPALVLRDLVTMLRIHAAAERTQELVAAAKPESDVVEAMVGYFKEMLDWQKRNGFFGAYGANKKVVFDNFIHGPDAETVRAAWKQYTQGRGHPTELQTSVVTRLTSLGYVEPVVSSLPGQLFGTHKPGEGDFNPIYRQVPPNAERRPWLAPQKNPK